MTPRSAAPHTSAPSPVIQTPSHGVTGVNTSTGRLASVGHALLGRGERGKSGEGGERGREKGSDRSLLACLLGVGTEPGVPHVECEWEQMPTSSFFMPNPTQLQAAATQAVPPHRLLLACPPTHLPFHLLQPVSPHLSSP
eukprot:216893-Chlamydomonas_euryale.AAC.1